MLLHSKFYDEWMNTGFISGPLQGLPNLDCVGCRSKGKFYAEIMIHVGLGDVSEDDYADAALDIVPDRGRNRRRGGSQADIEREIANARKDTIKKMEAAVESQRAPRRRWKSKRAKGGITGILKRSILDKIKNGFDKFKDFVKNPVKTGKEEAKEKFEHVKGKVEGIKDRFKDVLGLDPNGGELDFVAVFVMLMRVALKEAYAQVEVDEDIDLALQLEFGSQVGLDFTAGVDIYPEMVLPFFSWSFDFNGLK
jgi:hypothetical protein